MQVEESGFSEAYVGERQDTLVSYDLWTRLVSLFC